MKRNAKGSDPTPEGVRETLTYRADHEYEVGDALAFGFRRSGAAQIQLHEHEQEGGDPICTHPAGFTATSGDAERVCEICHEMAPPPLPPAPPVVEDEADDEKADGDRPNKAEGAQERDDKQAVPSRSATRARRRARRRGEPAPE